MALTQGHKLDANTLALWRLDETAAGALFADAAGTYPVTTHAGSDTSTAGLIADGGKARVFSAAGFPEVHATTGAPATSAIVAACTAEAWIQLDPSWAANGGVTLHQVGANPSLSMEVLSTRALRARWTPAGSFDSPAAAIPLATRTHVAIRKNSATSVDLFINGVKITSATGAAATNSGAGEFTIGGAGVAYFTGTIDDVRWSSVARTDAEIAESYWRGLLDISPGPTQAPFRQSRTPYQDYHRQLSPTALLNPQGAAFEAAQGALKDAMFDRCLQSVKAKYPSVAPGDALAAIGADRMMPRGGSETDAAYAARLLNAWNTWPWAGTAYGLLQAFWSTGYRNVVLAQVRGGKQFTLDQGGTNLLLWSNDFRRSSWALSDVNVNSNATTAPDGTTTGLKVVEASVSNDEHFVEQVVAIPASQNGTFAVDAKAAERTWLFLSEVLRDNVNVPGIYFDLTNGVLGTIVSGGGVTPTGKITAIGNGWYRCEFTGSVGTGGTNPRIRIQLASANGTKVYAGTVNSGLFLTYSSVEQSAGPAGPYVQTYGAAVPSTIGAGSLVTSTMASGIWETDPLSSLSPASQSFWSKFDVLFPLPLMPPSFSWAGGIPGSGSTEAAFIRSLLQAWKPAHATVNRIVIGTQGAILGYPATRTLGSANGVLGGTSVVWAP